MVHRADRDADYAHRVLMRDRGEAGHALDHQSS
jgi:hypothetical protein